MFEAMRILWGFAAVVAIFAAVQVDSLEKILVLVGLGIVFCTAFYISGRCRPRQ